MGIYINPGNESFKTDVNSKIYVDKTGLLVCLNEQINTAQNHICVSHARRFGKSVAAGMLKAYYSTGCDSSSLFAPYEVARSRNYRTHLNQYHVLHFDVSSFLTDADEKRETVSLLEKRLFRDVQRTFPGLVDSSAVQLHFALSDIWLATHRKFIIIIDEWDCIIRETRNDGLVHEYLQFLRRLLKSEESKEYLALGYLTGILPIKKIEGESALNNFYEYTMTEPLNLAAYFGFTQKETEVLCRKYEMDSEKIRQWYDGYHMSGHHIYNPNSVVQALFFHKIGNYWKNTSSFEVINQYIGLNYSGLKEAALQLMSGQDYPVNVKTFQNDLAIIRNKDEALTALIHLGYLGYNEAEESAFIPNEEVRAAFESAISVSKWNDIREALEHADSLLEKTLNKDAAAVADEISHSQMDYASIIKYNDENSLACAVMMAYYTARNEYTIIREFPSGKGYADIAFLPKPACTKPALLVELKWNQSADTALNQIKNKRYAGALQAYKNNLLLVGINYQKQTREVHCLIERYPGQEI